MSQVMKNVLRAALGVGCSLALLVPMGRAQGSICAQVKIQISQKAVLTRDAFEATLTIDNNTAGPLENLLVTLVIEDADGNDQTHLFDTSTLELTNVSDVSGTGDIASGVTATAQWTIIPEPEAVPGPEPVLYRVRGTVQHFQEGILVSVPLYPVEIEVYPQPELWLDYYLAKQVYGDNTWTPTTYEPVEPFFLGLIVRNLGYGEAKDLKIATSQPKIVDNEKGLLIAFQLIGAQLGTQLIAPCLTLDLGTIAPGGAQSALWLMTSTLQGHFVDVKASFKHTSGLGNEDLSLIESTKAWFATHAVDLDVPGVSGAADAADDDLFDFLVDLPGDPYNQVPLDPVTSQPMIDFPDELHASHTGAPLQLVPNVSGIPAHAPTEMDLSVELDVTVVTPGWQYVRLDDPGLGAFGLAQVIRSDAALPRETFAVGGPGEVCNAWQTDRLVPTDGSEFGPPPYYQQRLVHFVDWVDVAGTFRYDLVYSPVPTEPFSSNVDALSLSQGGIQTLELNAGAVNAGRFYLVLGSASGTSPGFPLGGGLTLPLVIPDPYFNQVLSAPLTPPAVNFLGSLDAFGRAQAKVLVPLGTSPAFAGITLNHAYVLFHPILDFVSNAVPVTLIP